MKRGPKPKPNCPSCGVLKTPENTYIKANGKMFNTCKECELTRASQKRFRSMSPERAIKMINTYKLRIKELRKCLKQIL